MYRALTPPVRQKLEQYKTTISERKGEDPANRVALILKHITSKRRSKIKTEIVFASVNDAYTEVVNSVFETYKKINVVQNPNIETLSTSPFTVLLFNSDMNNIKFLNVPYLNYLSKSTPNLLNSVSEKTAKLFSTAYVPMGKAILVSTNDNIIPFVTIIPLFDPNNSIDMYVGMRTLFRVFRCMKDDAPDKLVIPVLTGLTTNDVLLLREAYDDTAY